MALVSAMIGLILLQIASMQGERGNTTSAWINLFSGLLWLVIAAREAFA